MKKFLKRSALVLLAILILIQLYPYGRDHTNPPVTREPVWDTAATRELAVRACYDCHSNETKWPWYASVAPMSWFVQDHVVDGRRHLNFSEWDRPQKHAYEASGEVEGGWMPLESYVPLHPEAKLSQAEKAALVKGLKATIGEKPRK